ncbi:STAS domain-containing protein [Oerskovia flava]|uniref:STAS domain-containing protein n=1 Tax=Oerskovia flava TaxID=2986422 RepID=UPI00223EC1F3|nr:STAS domain-containing protein [Oerskovia sp. JB1-3-2]
MPNDEHGGVRIEDDGARWVLWGEVDAAVQARYEDRVVSALGDVSGPVTVDLSDVTFMDSGGLRLLYRAVHPTAGNPVLVDVPARIRDLLEISGVAALFTFVDEAGTTDGSDATEKAGA